MTYIGTDWIQMMKKRWNLRIMIRSLKMLFKCCCEIPSTSLYRCSDTNEAPSFVAGNSGGKERKYACLHWLRVDTVNL